MRLMLIALAAVGCAIPAAAQVPTDAALRQQAERSLRSCDGLTGDDAQWCQMSRQAFVSAFQQAYRGNYQAQRNVGYMLRGSTSGIAADHVEACAWRLIIIAQGDPQADASDTANLRFDCGRLDARGRATAEARAQALLGQIRLGAARR
ncbi:hypothetical protein KPL78_29705 [Roseomonas sp. HJA6]|uniref:DUF1311 domain-containing protein n=1 Tax=Roseomonas alba TaxID=2846776 RepID=A0ABS7AIB6_9PROT|nr:hypothetical protein [Neoroseomonas alba]MBW6402059.1 hypothetical protein [Neoroseomonas alba]